MSSAIVKAFIEETGGHRLEAEMQSVYDELTLRRIPIDLFTEKRVHRRQLPISRDSLVVGYVPTIPAALQILNIEPPPTNDYPPILHSLLQRRLWASTVQDLFSWVYDDRGPIFAKPKGRKKRFTGRVFRHPDDLQYLEGASKLTPIYCSTPVEWLTEYRVFVSHAHIVGIRHYDGDPSIIINEQVAVDAVQALEQSGQGTRAYAIDFGVMATGETALVEWNDGFSLGAYGLDKSIYTDLLITRWCEITGC